MKPSWLATPEVEARRLARLRAAVSHPMSPDTKAKLRDALRAKWASGTRKPNSPDAYKKAAATYRNRVSAGKARRRTLTSEQAKQMGALVSHDNLVAANRRSAAARIGKDMALVNRFGKPSRGAKSSLHWKGKWWEFERHDGAHIEGRNLNELIRRNSDMFLPSDVVWRKSWCRASKGLGDLLSGRPNGPQSWKGWYAVSKRDGGDT